MKLNFHFISFLCIIIIIGCSGNLKVLKCPPNDEPVVVLKNIDKAYPVYAVSYNSNLIATLRALDSLQVSVDAVLVKKIEELREKLNQESSRVEMHLKTSLLALQTTPCDLKVRNEFWNLLNKINENAIELNELSKRLKQLDYRNPNKLVELIDNFYQKYSIIE